jgi:hypothetical protein
MYASLLRISGALHLCIFEQPANKDFSASSWSVQCKKEFRVQETQLKANRRTAEYGTEEFRRVILYFTSMSNAQ